MFLIPPFALRAGESLYWFCQRWMPSNILIRHVYARARLSGVALLVALGALCAAIAFVSAALVQQGHSGWWNLGFLLGGWDALKFAGHGVRLLALVVAARLRRAQIQGEDPRASASPTGIAASRTQGL